jgi:DNA-binding NarL/FixJ family response regulator
MTSSPSSRIKVALRHSDPLISVGLAATLRERHEFEVDLCSPTLTLATSSSLRTADIVVADYDTGLRLLASVATQNPAIVLLTHHQSEAQICHALEQGARGYLLLSCGIGELIAGLRSVHAGDKAIAPLVASRIADRMQQQALTRREMEILRQLMLGLRNKAIACKLTMSEGTVKTHVKSILRKLDASSRTEAAAISQRRGIVQEERESMHSRSNVGLPESRANVGVERRLELVAADAPLGAFGLRKFG